MSKIFQNFFLIKILLKNLKLLRILTITQDDMLLNTSKNVCLKFSKNFLKILTIEKFAIILF